MIQSMTGYGKATAELSDKKINIEIKSLNSKAMDLSARIAPLYREKEMEIRNEISKMLERGKVDFSLWIEKKDAEQLATPINQELVDKGLASYAEKGIKAHGYVCDVTDEPAVQAMVATIAKEVGTIDILVNNAGIIRRVPMHEMEAADFRRVIDIDLNAPFIVSKAVLPAMMEKGHGKIINICSMMSELGRETVSAYAAAKGGLKMLTRNICSEYGEYNIQCNGIGPGYIATPQTAPLREKQADGSRHPFDSFICAKTPAGRWLAPEELTGPAVFLASEASNAVNGHILYVDGGILAYIGKQPK